MADIKTNIQDGAYVALGACALGVSHLAKKREYIVNKFNDASSQISPKLNDAACNVSEKFSTSVAPKASSIIDKVKKQSESAISSSVKIAQEAKKRIK